MGQTYEQFGSVFSLPNEDCRIVAKGIGDKSALAIVCSYRFVGAPAVPAGTVFYGRVTIWRGSLTVPFEIDVNTDPTALNLAPPVFDAILNGPGDRTFLFPLEKLFGRAAVGGDDTLSICLSRGQTDDAGDVFQGFLNAWGRVIA